TVSPLIDLWGFGRHRQEGVIPSDADIARARALVDYRQLEVDPVQARAKKHIALTIDVNGIAQGYSVDQVADVLTAAGCSDYLVELGGELRLAGHNPQQKLWRIGIEKPVDGFGGAQQALRATGIGVTTAGDYHDYFEKDGVRYSHTIDPRTGRPIAHKLASVTVVADNATLADGWDTALEVMGPEAGFDFAEKHKIAAFFIVREGDQFVTRYSSPMKGFLSE
ncbi:MAG TPA: FAD:protein FMN transferase, partial [Spongiibacteraceae bacterium]|nr:FAD:protein FMN transferase [Spongiibacteraceae bacterium]